MIMAMTMIVGLIENFYFTMNEWSHNTANKKKKQNTIRKEENVTICKHTFII